MSALTTPPMRIVMLGPFGLHPKGTMRARAAGAARALAGRGHRVTVIMPPWQTPEAAGRRWTEAVASAGRIDPGPGAGSDHGPAHASYGGVDPEVRGGVDFEYVSLRGLGVPALGHLVVAWRMARHALAAKPDVVVAFKPKAYSGLAAALLWLRGRVGLPRPAIVVDTDDWEGAGGWNTIEPYPAPMRRFFAWQERWGLTHADRVTVASRALETLAWSLGVDPAAVTYLPNAIDDTGMAAGSDREGIPDDAIRAENGSRADDASRPDDAGRADIATRADRARPADHADRPDLATRADLAAPVLLLYTRFHDHDPRRPLDVLERVRRGVGGARLVVAGRGLFGEEVELAREAAARGLGDAVEVLGWVEPEQAAALFAAADVAIAPFDDSLVNRARSSMKLIELLAAGVPVVAEAVGEARELIADGGTGRLVPPGDVSAFADAVVELLRDPAARADMGRAAAARMGREHAWSGRVLALEALCSAAVAARGSARRPR